MKNTLVNALVFTAGAAIGALVTWKYVESKYAKIAQEEIDSVKEVFARRQAEYDKAEELVDGMAEELNHSESVANDLVHKIAEKPDLHEYAKLLTEEGYTDYSKSQKVEEGGGAPTSDEDKPYVIHPDEFGMKDDYLCESLNYFADGVLADDWHNRIEDVENLVGEDSLTHFGEYDDDLAVYVRNDLMGKDFEILKDYRNFSEVENLEPHAMNIHDEDE